jgi:23S rRNA (cytidine1920-2'-O)/16S rRNA (cytidine1409-2'-O)-methyltransferase
MQDGKRQVRDYYSSAPWSHGKAFLSSGVTKETLRMPSPPAIPARQRLDQALVARGLVPTRARARDLILRGEVEVDGRVASKPALLVSPAERLRLVSGPADYVSRGSLKLQAALDYFRFAPAGRTALDVGASTGGFTEALLVGGARRVYAVENGHGQLHPRLAADARVVSLERTDARMLDARLIPDPIDAIVADVSFISLTKVLPAALALSAAGSWLVALVKPQFEGEPDSIPRDGIIKDPMVQTAAVERIVTWLAGETTWRVMGTIPSPIHGGDGNVEFLIGAVRNA